MNKVYGVIFKAGGKNYYFKSDIDLNNGDYVIVETDRGLQFAKVSLTNVNKVMDTDLKQVIRLATDQDYQNHLRNLKDADKAFKKCIQLVKELGLDMNVANAEFTFDRNQLLFNFTADERVDFRELARKLAGIYHTRIELHQIGARDKAKEIGGIGICGRKLCCGNFLNQIETVSMNMAKNQNITLNPSKINGLCGRLLCCLAYEDGNYLEASKGMPSVGDQIKTEKGKGTVQSVDILNRKCKILIGEEKEEIYINENCQK